MSWRVIEAVEKEIREGAFAVRRRVFIQEQGVSEEEEWDEYDSEAIHVAALDGRRVIGTARLVVEGNKGKIGRMAVDREYRRRGVGRAVMNYLIEKAIELGLTELYLHSQLHAKPFYEKLGFKAEGNVFMEANIPHVVMRLRLY